MVDCGDIDDEKIHNNDDNIDDDEDDDDDDDNDHDVFFICFQVYDCWVLVETSI